MLIYWHQHSNFCCHCLVARLRLSTSQWFHNIVYMYIYIYMKTMVISHLDFSTHLPPNHFSLCVTFVGRLRWWLVQRSGFLRRKIRFRCWLAPEVQERWGAEVGLKSAVLWWFLASLDAGKTMLFFLMSRWLFWQKDVCQGEVKGAQDLQLGTVFKTSLVNVFWEIDCMSKLIYQQVLANWTN